MKSASSLVASDDLEASGNGNPASKTKSNRDHLDLATDFPPLSASEASETAKSDQFVPKWVTKTSAGNSAVPPFPVAGATATIEKSRETETNTTENNDFTEKNNSDQQNNPNSSSSSMSFSPSAVIDASDVNSCKKPPPGGSHHQGRGKQMIQATPTTTPTCCHRRRQMSLLCHYKIITMLWQVINNNAQLML